MRDFILIVLFVAILAAYWLFKLVLVVFFDGGHWLRDWHQKRKKAGHND